MNPAPSAPVCAVPPAQPPIVAAWPRSAQLATAFLLGLTAALLAIHVYGSSRWSSKPTVLDRGAVLAYRIDLNQADRAELLQLPGVGDALAGRIEAYRREKGRFRSVDELVKVGGIGPTSLARLRPWVCVQSADDEEEEEAANLPTTPRPAPAKKPGVPTPAEPGSKKAQALTQRINVNTASAEELQKLPRIGPKLAQRIIDERSRSRFKSVEDLRRVSGIGAKTLDLLRPLITVESLPLRVVAADES